MPSSPAGAAALPRRGGWSCSRNACATAAQHARPHAREGKGSPRTERRVPHRAGQRAAHLAMRRASASTAANAGAEGALSPPHMLPRLGPLFALVLVEVRIKRPTGRGGMAVRPRTPRGTAMSLDPCLQCTVASARRERSSAIERALLQTRCDGREARQFAQWGAKRGITETCTCGFTKSASVWMGSDVGPRCDGGRVTEGPGRIGRYAWGGGT